MSWSCPTADFVKGLGASRVKDVAASSPAGVRKHPREEPAHGWQNWCGRLYGDLRATSELADGVRCPFYATCLSWSAR